SHPRCAEFMGQYPVIHLSFKNVKSASKEESMDLMKSVIADEFERHNYLLDREFLDELKIEYYTKIQNKKGTDGDYTQSIKYLSAWLHRAYGKPPYILLDEYDTPLHSAHVDKYYDQMIAFIRSFMVQTFKDNPHLKQAVLIGILKIAQESIFSDFNNPRVSTILSSAMKDCFGFTEAEVEKMASYFGLESTLDGIKEWYNGYIFGGNTVIYNPWSIVNYLSSPDEGLKPHWISTSDNRLVKEVIKLKRRDAIMTTEKLLRKEEVRKPLLTNIPYTQIENDPDVVWSFLLHSGYLKASERQQEHTHITWRLSIPNLEVETAWETVVLNWLKEDLSVNEDFADFVSGIREANPHLIERGLKRILFGLSSYYDSARDEKDRRENFYHGLVLGLLAYLGSAYAVDSNREYGRGRSDIVVVRKGSDPAQAEKAFVFEF
ncbi:MAG: AAA family ATPase, partial [Candidatus Thiodiazotropha endolucinida]